MLLLYPSFYASFQFVWLGDDDNPTETVSEEFTQRTDQLLQYISKTYLTEGFAETEEGKRMMEKMEKSFSKLGDAINEAKKKEIGFDTLFMEEDEQKNWRFKTIIYYK